jgi:hypothetical protein
MIKAESLIYDRSMHTSVHPECQEDGYRLFVHENALELSLIHI